MRELHLLPAVNKELIVSVLGGGGEGKLSLPLFSFFPKISFLSLCERTFIRMQHFHILTVKEIREETPECVSIAFDVPADLKEDFKYIQGQYLTLRETINGEEVRRSYSLCSCPLDDEWRVAIKKLEGGRFSTWAHENLKTGDEIDVMPPQGRFYCNLYPKNENNYIMFASGSGITPIMSTIKTILKTEPKSEIQLFYGNKNIENIIFRDELEDLKNIYLGRFTVHYILSRQAQESDWFNGRIDLDKLKNYAKVFFDPKEVDGFFICGPQPMLLALRDGLMEMGVEKPKVHVELFSSYVESNKEKEEAWKEEYKGKAAKVQVIVDGKTLDFVLPYGGNSILDGALRKGADLPYACKGGVCCTCKAKVLEGEVEMTVNYGLEDDEVENGYILTCQSHPRTENLVVDFDQ